MLLMSSLGLIFCLCAAICLGVGSPSPNCPSGCDCEHAKTLKPCKEDFLMCEGNHVIAGQYCDGGEDVKDFATACQPHLDDGYSPAWKIPTSCNYFSDKCWRTVGCVADDEETEDGHLKCKMDDPPNYGVWHYRTNIGTVCCSAP